jgi:hypothetical protein
MQNKHIEPKLNNILLGVLVNTKISVKPKELFCINFNLSLLDMEVCY